MDQVHWKRKKSVEKMTICCRVRDEAKLAGAKEKVGAKNPERNVGGHGPGPMS
jgi:hypothetical protein